MKTKMKKQEREKTLYFSDEEIDNETQGEKKVFVTKRINGKESHAKINKRKKEDINKIENKKKEDVFNFNNEIVIGVNLVEEKDKQEIKKEKKSSKNKKQKKRKKSYNNKLKDQYKEKDKNKKDKKKFNKKIIKYISILLIIVSCLVIACCTPIFNIEEINVEGNKKNSTESIISQSELKKYENIFKYRKDKVIENIKKNPYISEVSIKRKLPRTVNIKVTEREIKYQINFINSYVYIDKYGYILENSSQRQNVPIIYGVAKEEQELLGNTRLGYEDVEKLNDINKIMEAFKSVSINNIITEINAEKKGEFIIYIEEETKKIYIGNSSNLSNKILYIQKILENEKGKAGTIFINGDINSGFKPYFREE